MGNYGSSPMKLLFLGMANYYINKKPIGAPGWLVG